MRLASLAVLVAAVIILISIFMNADGLFSGFTGGGFSGFADALFVLTQALALPIIMAMLGMIGLRLTRRD